MNVEVKNDFDAPNAPRLNDEQKIQSFLAGYHRPNTVRNYERALLRFRSFIAPKELEQVNWHDLERYKAALMSGLPSGKPLSPSAGGQLNCPSSFLL